MSGGRGYSNGRGNGRGYGRFGNNNSNNGRGRGFRRSRFNNNNNRNSNKNNDLPKEALLPLTYETKPDKQIRTKIEWQHGRGSNSRTESEKISVYDDTAKEDYLRTLAGYREILNDHPYLKEDDEATTACRIFKKCLKGAARDSASEAISEINDGTIDSNEALEEVISATTNAILGNHAYDNQVEYLRNTKKPKKLTADDWMRRIRNINMHLANMGEDARKLTDKELIKDVIIPNIPTDIKIKLKMRGGSTLSWNDTKEMLTHIFDLINFRQSKKRNGNNNKKGGNHSGNSNRNRGYNNNNNEYNNSNNNGNNKNNNNGREETYQQRKERNETNRTDSSSYYSEDEEREESNMMKARMQCRSRNEEATG